ncbi:damage-control phosphatase ARMT1 family protein, partial [Streptomyces sp. NPDC048845]|uniref:damage-control phosphatase ARMT1 family protein n=1 Tax=Streptomyces sp. NPDC048845 TaxID=3155390 RepID=UPI00341F93BA
MERREPEAADTEAAAPEILGNVPGSFPWGVWHDRHPALVERLLHATPYGPGERQALRDLLAETLDGVIQPLPASARDRELWHGDWDRGHFGKRWTDAPFLWAESYFYRRLREALGYSVPGPWRGIDPFAPMKDAELAGDTVDGELAALDGGSGPGGRSPDELSPDERTDALVLAALWGNRADLGFRITGGEPGAGGAESLVADERPALRELLRAAGERRGRIVLVADNAGRELIPDLLLIDHLLLTGAAAEVALHVKPHPYYVSDATTADVLAGLRRLVAAPGTAGETGRRLWEAMSTGRLAVRAHAFSCAPLTYAAMPGDLRADFGTAALTIFKGDLNYRRLVGDRDWPATTATARRRSSSCRTSA